MVKHDLSRLAPVVERAITEQAQQKRHRLAQDVLRKLSQAVEQAADSIFITNRQCEFEYVNSRRYWKKPALRQTGWSWK